MIGGGITGLTAAYRVLTAEPDVDVVVLEAGDAVGGKMRSVTVGGVRVEAGPDSLLARKPWAVDLCRELGLGDALIGSAVADAQLWDGHRPLPFPRGVLGIPVELFRFLAWPGLPLTARARVFGDLVVPKRDDTGQEESVGELLRRRVGVRATESLVAPLLGGVVGGDVDRLSVESTFPELAAWERRHRSLILGARAAAKRRPAGGGPVFVTLRGGLERLPHALADVIGMHRVRTGVLVQEVVSRGGRYLVRHADGEEPADAVIATAPPRALAEMLPPVAGGLREPLTALKAASTALVALVYAEGTAEVLGRTSGFIARGGSLPIRAATIVSAKWPDPSFGSRAVVRCFVGDHAELRRDDDEIVGDAGAALAHVYGLPVEPEAGHVVRWPHAMPQYEVGHVARVAAIDGALPPGIVVAGQGFRGVGISDCVRQANEAASRVVAHLRDGVPTS